MYTTYMYTYTDLYCNEDIRVISFETVGKKRGLYSDREDRHIQGNNLRKIFKIQIIELLGKIW